MLVSIIIPTYNSEKFLQATIDSALNQTHQNIEILIVDNGSTDSTLKIIQNNQQKTNLIKVFHESRKGANYARNLGLKEAKGEFIQFLDSDDILVKAKIEKQLLIFKNGNYDLVVCNRSNYNENLTHKLNDFNFFEIEKKPLEVCITKIIITGNPLYKKSSIENIGGWDETLPSAQDWELHIRMALNNFQFGFINESLLISRIHESSLSFNWVKVNLSCINVLEKYKNQIKNNVEYSSMEIQKKIFYFYYLGAVHHDKKYIDDLKSWNIKPIYKICLFGFSKIIYLIFGLKLLVTLKSIGIKKATI